MNPLVILQSYNRPTMIVDALEGIKNQTFKDFFVVVVDDGSDFDVMPIVYDILKEPTPVVRVCKLPKMSMKNRIWNNRQGWYLNEIVQGTNADFFVINSDDDVMHPEYIEKTRQYFIDNPEVMYAYGPCREFDRTKGEKPNDESQLVIDFKQPVSGKDVLDICQVAFRTKPFQDKEKALMFPEGKFWGLDGMVFRQLEKMYGKCPYFPHMTMYKGMGSYTLTHAMHKSGKPPEEWIEQREKVDN